MASIIDCPNCSARYEIPAAIPPQGRQVRCAKCEHVWTAQAVTPLLDDDDIIFRDFEAEPRREAVDAGGEADATGEPEPRAQALDAEPEAAAEAVPDAEAAVPEPEPDMDDIVPQRAAAADSAADEGAYAEDDAYRDELDDPDPRDDQYGDELDDLRYPDRGEPAPFAIERRSARRGLGRAGLGWGALALLLIFGSAFAYLQRVEIVRAVPGMAQLYGSLGVPVNARGLEFEDVGSTWTADGGRLYLEVRGEVVNVAATPVRVPTVLFLVRDEREEEIFRWAANIRAEPLVAGERARFVARVPAPSEGAHSLQLRFIEAR